MSHVEGLMHCNKPTTPANKPIVAEQGKQHIQAIVILLDVEVFLGQSQIIQWMKEKKFDLNEENGWGKTPAVLAAESNQVAVIRELLAGNIDFNKSTSSKEKSVPLLIALKEKNWDMVALMLLTSKNLTPELKNSIADHRDELTTAFIRQAKLMGKSEREQYSQDVVQAGNVLGEILSTSKKAPSFLANMKHPGMTEKIFRIAQELNVRPEVTASKLKLH